MGLNKITFTNIILDNLNNSISENGKVDLEHFINLTNKTYEAITVTRCCKSDSELLSKGIRTSKECDNTEYPEKTYTGYIS